MNKKTVAPKPDTRMNKPKYITSLKKATEQRQRQYKIIANQFDQVQDPDEASYYPTLCWAQQRRYIYEHAGIYL